MMPDDSADLGFRKERRNEEGDHVNGSNLGFGLLDHCILGFRIQGFRTRVWRLRSSVWSKGVGLSVLGLRHRIAVEV